MAVTPVSINKAVRVGDLEQYVMLTTVEKAIAWSSSNSIWPAGFGLACCAIEMMSLPSPRYDIARFGAEVFRSSPRQADLLIVSGRVAHKMAPAVRQVYDQMLVPKWVMAMGACSSSGGMFANYAILQGVDKIIPVDVHVPGVPTPPGSRGRRPDGDPEEDPRRHRAGLRAGEVEGVSADELAAGVEAAVPGALEALPMRRTATLTVRRESLLDVCRHLRDALGRNFLSAVSAVDYLGYGEEVAGYFGTERGRDINRTGRGARPRRRSRCPIASPSTTTWPIST